MELSGPGEPLRLVVRNRGHTGTRTGPLRVSACGVCRTDLHIVDGELPALDRPVVPGHEIVGTVAESGSGAEQFQPGERVGVSWLGLDLRDLPLLCPWAGEPVRRGPLHRLPVDAVRGTRRDRRRPDIAAAFDANDDPLHGVSCNEECSKLYPVAWILPSKLRPTTNSSYAASAPRSYLKGSMLTTVNWPPIFSATNLILSPAFMCSSKAGSLT